MSLYFDIMFALFFVDKLINLFDNANFRFMQNFFAIQLD